MMLPPASRLDYVADYFCYLQMLNIHLRGMEVPACNAGKCLFTLICIIKHNLVGRVQP